jgi:tRNA U34 2-thiouridine synthase MnmA/TrmU
VVDRVKLRYRSAAVPGRLSGAPAPGAHGTLVACLEEDAFGVAAGQTASLMQGERVVGHGTIARDRVLN